MKHGKDPAAALLLVLLAGLQGAGCSTVPEPVRVPVACIEQLPDRPSTYSDEEVAAMPDGALVLALHADRLAWRAYALELRAAAGPCVASSTLGQ